MRVRVAIIGDDVPRHPARRQGKTSTLLANGIARRTAGGNTRTASFQVLGRNLRPRARFEVIGNSVRIGNLATSGGRHVPRPVCHAAARARSASGR